MTNTRPRYSAENYTYSYATEPAYYYVWDAKEKVQIGGNFATRESAQEDADRRNRAVEATLNISGPGE